MNKNLKQYLLILVLFIVGLVGCAWKSSTKQDHNNCIKEMQEQLPDWYENVWTEEFSEAMVKSFSYEEDVISIELVLRDDIEDYSITIKESLELLDRNDNDLHAGSKTFDIYIGIAKNRIISPMVAISNREPQNVSWPGETTNDDGDEKVKRFCIITEIDNNTSFPYISKEFDEHINMIYLPYFLNDLSSFNSFTNVDSVYIGHYNETQKDDFDQFISDMEERGIEVIVK